MVKKLNDRNLLPKFKKTLTIQKMWNLNSFEIQSIFQNFKFQESLSTWKWAVMCITYKTKL
jgi:hypothetical protein